MTELYQTVVYVFGDTVLFLGGGLFAVIVLLSIVAIIRGRLYPGAKYE